MGTNFYWKVGNLKTPTGRTVEPDEDEIHIGKRSAAGLYCWDCNVTLCKRGNGGIHHDSDFHDECPKCGAKPIAGTLESGPAAVELGFAQPETDRPRGARGCSSFRWAEDPAEVRQCCNNNPNTPIIEDEYGRELTGREFLAMLDANCPVEFLDSIGSYFS